MAFVQAFFEECWPSWQQHLAPEARLRLGGVRLTELTDDPWQLAELASHYLSTDELGQFSGFSQKKRQSEWLGGRLAAKWAAAGLMGKNTKDWLDIAILCEEDGRPYLRAKTEAPFLSISHNGPLAIAMAANLPCGLDIQQPDAKLHTVQKRFIVAEEEDILSSALSRSFSKTERLALLWAAKEAVRKMIKISPLLGLLEIKLLQGLGGCGTPQDPLALIFFSTRTGDDRPPMIPVLCFFVDNLAWSLTCLP